MADPTTPPPPRIAAHPLLNLPPTMSVGALNSDHVNRMINSAHTPSPSRTICSDRFIPSRSSSNFALFNLPPSPSVSSSTPDGKDDVGSSSSSAYTALLRAALFGPDTPDRKDAPGASNNIFRYKTETKRSLQSLYPFGFEEADTTVVPNPVKAPRKVPRSPYKVLDAPALQDDFYLNLVDWSSHNVLAVGLGNCVYLWNACSSKVTKLCDLGIDDSVCSVGWAQRGTQLAVGTSNGKVQIWDAARCRNVRTMEGHRLRVGSLAWSSSLLSTGSRDKCILQRDIRTQDDFVSKLSGHKSEVCGLKWSYDNRELASGGNDNRLFVWNQHSTQPVLKYCEHTAAVKAIAWSPHIRGLLASGGGTADRCIRFWNTSANSHLSCIDTGSQVCNLVWSKNVNELVSTHGYSQNQVIVWRYPTMSKMDRRLLPEQAMKRLDFGTYFRLPNLRTMRARLEHFHLEEQLFVDFYSSSNLVVLHNTVNVEALDRCVKFSTASCPFPLLVQVENYMQRDQMDTAYHLKIDYAAMYGGILLLLCFLPFVVYLACHASIVGFLIILFSVNITLKIHIVSGL